MTVNRWSATVPVAMGLMALLILLGGFMAWATLTQIAGAIIAPGRIEVDQNRQIVQHPKAASSPKSPSRKVTWCKRGIC